VRARIEYFKPKGEVRIQFNKPMNFPDDFKDILNYWCMPKELRDSLSGPGEVGDLADENVSRMLRRLQEEIEQVLEVEIIKGEYSQNSNVTFSWNITAVNEMSIEIGVYAYHPVDVSAHSSPEQVKVIFHDKQMFFGKNGNQLETEETISKIPVLVVHPEFQAAMEKTTEVLADTTKYVAMTQYVINTLLASSLALLWSLINML